MKEVGVEFKEKGKLYTFFDNNLEIKLNDKVIVNTERGLQYGNIGALFKTPFIICPSQSCNSTLGPK